MFEKVKRENDERVEMMGKEVDEAHRKNDVLKETMLVRANEENQ